MHLLEEGVVLGAERPPSLECGSVRVGHVAFGWPDVVRDHRLVRQIVVVRRIEHLPDGLGKHAHHDDHHHTEDLRLHVEREIARGDDDSDEDEDCHDGNVSNRDLHF